VDLLADVLQGLFLYLELGLEEFLFELGFHELFFFEIRLLLFFVNDGKNYSKGA